MDLLDQYSEGELLITDITFLPLIQKAWEYSRGARTFRNYNAKNISDGTELRIKDEYNYTFENGMRDITGVQRHLYWYANDGSTVILTKDITKEFTAKSLGELNQEIRNGRITDLIENAKALPSGQVIVDSLYDWYGIQISEYIDRGTTAFEVAVRDEADVSRRALLDTSVPEFGGLTVSAIISFQLVGGYTW